MRLSAPGLFRVGDLPLSRIEAYSDGVFAIVVTLLVLEFRVPRLRGPDVEAALLHSLRAMTPKFLSYVLSFGIVCIWWVAHHHLFRLFRKSDRGLLWFNNLFLLWLAFIPFPTGLMGDYPSQRVAVMSYGVAVGVTGLSFSWMRYYAFFIGKLTHEGIDQGLLKGAMIKSALNPLLHFIAVLLALTSTKLAISFYLLIPVLFFIPAKLEKHPAAPADHHR